MTIESRLEIDATGFFAPAIGKSGLDVAQLRALAPRLKPLHAKLSAWRRDPALFLSLPYADTARAIVARGADLAKRFKRTIVFGIGGSSLGGQMLVEMLGDRDHTVDFYDNVDPVSLAVLDDVDWGETCLLVVSKSGNTAETLCQFLTVLPALERRIGSERLREQVYAVTEDPSGALGELARRLKLEILEHPPVGGRYSVLSVVGLLPAAIAGVDVHALLAGARAMAERCQLEDIEANPAFWNGAAQYLHAERGRLLSVHMTYTDALRPTTLWFRQLWAESLGKRDANGAHRGLTPVTAQGATDQHSQLQLYLAGPDDKQFSFLANPRLKPAGARVPERFKDIPAVAPLAGHSSGELLMAEYDATRKTLARHGRPYRTLHLDARDAHALGELIVLLEMETVVVAELLGVDPFDQPAVEEGKRLAREYLQSS